MRPPIGLLKVHDDGSEDGELIRLRGDRFVIGREAGDLTIPHDLQMSGRHAELARIEERGRWIWTLSDLGSTNGTFVRVGDTLLRPGQELILGGCRWRFELPELPPEVAAERSAAAKSTIGWQAASVARQHPALVEKTPEGEGRRLALAGPDLILGGDPTCPLHVADDPLLSPRHARFTKDAKGRWHVENLKSKNGVWLRVTRVPFEGLCSFQLGEQRFTVKILA